MFAHLMAQFFHLGERIAERFEGAFHVRVAVGNSDVNLLAREHGIGEDDVFDDGADAAELSTVD